MRLKYASLILYALNIGGMILGFAFTLLFTRRVSVEDYSVWVMISKYVGYLILPSVIYTNWIPRDISRGNNTSKTGLFSSVLFSMIMLPLYALLIYEASSSLNQPLIPLIISILILPLEYLNTVLSSIASGYAPQRTGYASFIMKLGQIASGYFLIGFLVLGLTGAVIAIVIGKLCSAIIGLYLNSGLLKNSAFSRKTLSSWLRSSWLHAMGILYALVFSLDVLVVRIFFGSEIPVAYYGLCMSITSLALFAGVVSSTVYPRIISKKSFDDLRDSIWLTLFLSMPAFFILLFFTDPICALFKLDYLPMANALRVFAFSAIIQTLLSLIAAAYAGLDPFDESALTAKSLYKSALFKSNLIVLLVDGAYLLTLLVICQIEASAQQFILMWSLIFTGCFATQFIIFNYMIKRDFGIVFPFKTLFKDIITFTMPAIPAALISFFWKIPLENTFYFAFLNLLYPVATSMLFYVGLLFIISRKFRAVVNAAIHALSLKK